MAASQAKLDPAIPVIDFSGERCEIIKAVADSTYILSTGFLHIFRLQTMEFQRPASKASTWRASSLISLSTRRDLSTLQTRNSEASGRTHRELIPTVRTLRGAKAKTGTGETPSSSTSSETRGLAKSPAMLHLGTVRLSQLVLSGAFSCLRAPLEQELRSD
ncbi:hypothetical protein SELMODRAFT_426958 [Selaginella moellendorffii]|uniref:Uncharacterized protein n=1 Tax=Selaginella moellendorffii TaxID=88036 RepID=D8SY15_SELML|nr:hypothetical protein SELMODRAFT_426958 [Selaginella moellendorffii]